MQLAQHASARSDELRQDIDGPQGAVTTLASICEIQFLPESEAPRHTVFRGGELNMPRPARIWGKQVAKRSLERSTCTFCRAQSFINGRRLRGQYDGTDS